MRVKKTLRSQRPKRPAAQLRWKRTPGAKASAYVEWALRSRGFVFAAMFVIVAAALLTAREDSPRTEPVEDTVQLEPIAATRTAAVTPVSAKPASAAVARPQPSAAASAPAQTEEEEPVRVATVTISGCVDNDDDAFRLIDAAGEEAPTARSWKSGFLKKRPASIALEDATGTLALRSHVGRRISATGTLVDREMRVRSLRVLGSCE